MNDYSDIIYMMGAMLIFSMLSMQAVQMFNRNDRFKTVMEIEYNAATLAQDHIDQVRWLKTQAAFDEWESDFPKMVDAGAGDYTIPFTVSCEVEPYSQIEDPDIQTLVVTIVVDSIYLSPGGDEASAIRMQIVKSFLN